MAPSYDFEKLYLAKGKAGKQAVCVEKCPLVQHQLDGIRYLYKAWTKKWLGVILNDPSGYGKRVQTTLFLSAVLPSLDKAVLILCREGREQLWINHFQTWTQDSRDVDIEVTNPFNKKRVLIAPSYAAAGFARREWSFLVVDDDLTKELVKSSLRADLKVWITSSNIKKDLSGLSTFVSWIHPKDKFDGDVFKADEQDLRDVLSKDAMLDAYLEDLLLRRSNLELPYTCRIQVPVTSDVTESTITVTKKNKDITGTKIKRTKRKTADKGDDAPRKVAKTVNSVNSIENSEVFDMGIMNLSSLDVSKGLVIASSVGDGTPLSIANKRNMKPSNMKLIWDSDSDSEFSANKPIVKSVDTDNELAHLDEEINRNSLEVDYTLEISGTSKVFRLESDTDVSDDDLPKNARIGANDDSNLKDTEIDAKLNNNEITNTVQDTDVSGDDLLINTRIGANNGNVKDYEIDVKSNNNEIKYNLQDTDEIEIIETKYSEDLFSTDFTAVNEMNKRKTEQIIEALPNVSVCETNHCTGAVLPSDSIQIRTNQSAEHKPPETMENSEEHRNCTEKKPLKDANLSEFDLKMKQLEEMALKKFKGSFLDTMF